MSQIAASIIVPCYKVEQYLPRCLDSLVNQTLKNIEIICINDGSPDSCITILKDYQSRYPDKIVIIDKKNEGVWKGRWDGIKIARGEYIGFVDSDDYVEPTFAEDLYSVAKNANADLSVAGFSRIDLDTGKRLSSELCSQRNPFNIQQEPGRIIELNGAPWNKFFRTNILKNMNDLEKPPAVLDDLLFHMLAYLDMEGDVVFTPKNLINYMVRSDSIINTITQEKLQTGYDAFLEVKKYYLEKNASPQLMQALDAVAFLHLGISMNFRMSYSKDINLNKELSKTTLFLDEHFPSWKNSPYINLSFAKENKGAFIKLLIAQKLYKAHLMKPFLGCYRFLIDKIKVDIKW